MIKRFIVIFTLLTITFTSCAYAKTVEFTVDRPTYSSFDSYKKETSALLAAPFIKNDRTMVPVRAISENFGCTVNWDGSLKLVTITDDEKVIKLTIDNSIAYINETATVLDCAPCIVNDTTFVPIRFVTEALGYNVIFVPTTRSVLVCDDSDVYVANNLSASFPEVEALTYILSDESLTSDELSLYTATYLIKLLVLEKEANKLSLTIPDNKKDEILNTVVTLTSEFPVSKGGFARILERDALGTEYIDHIKKDDEISSLYNENYACIKYVLINSGTETKNKSIANTVYRKATSGTNFNTLIERYCEDEIMTSNPDGLIYQMFVVAQTFGDEILKLKENSVSKPIKTDYGYVVVKRLPLPKLPREIEEDICYSLYTLPLIEKTLAE